MKTFLILLFGLFLGWAANSFYSGFLYGKLQVETGGDIYDVCEQLLINE